ncbi:hypothetical protein IH575_03050, partial [Candidatus Dojkabacteria bacterium]|nr:hypothetical protein [Candidatus Dojkabacteria bacterium]
ISRTETLDSIADEVQYIWDSSQETKVKADIHFVDTTEYLTVGKPEMAVDSYYMGLQDTLILGYDWLNAADYAEALKNGTEDSVALQSGYEYFTVNVGTLTPAEIKSMQKFITRNIQDPSLFPASMQSAAYTWSANTNLAFLDYVARRLVSQKQDFPPSLPQLYSMLQEWIPQVVDKSASDPFFVEKYFSGVTTDRMARRREEAYALTRVAESWRNVIGEPGYENAEVIAQSFEAQAMKTLVDTYHYFDQFVIPINPYEDWTAMTTPGARDEGYRYAANAEMQLLRPLSRTEITQLMYYRQDPETELLGEVFIDFSFLLNVVPKVIVGAAKLSSRGVKAVAALSDIGRVPKFVTKLGWKDTPKILRTVGKGFASFDAATAKASMQAGVLLNKMQNTRLVKYIATRSMYSVATKRGQSASDLTMRILKQNPMEKNAWVKLWSDAATFTNKAAAAEDPVSDIVRGLFNPIFNGKVTERQLLQIMELNKTIEPARWADEAAKVWDDVYATLYDEARNKIMFKRGKPVFSTITEEVRNQIDAAVKQEWDGWYAKHLLSDRMNNVFRDVAMNKFSNKLGRVNALKDSIPGMIAKIPFGRTGKMLGESRLGAALGGLEYINRAFMRMWTWATLARRPAWVVQNFVDNVFRYMMAAADVDGNIFDLMNMLSTSKYYDDLIKSGITIPSTITSGVVQDLTKMVSVDADKVIEALTLAKKTQELSASPLNLLSHYKLAYEAIAEGTGLFGKVWAAFKAFPTSIKTLNNSIEVGMKTHMYYKMYIKNIERLNVRAVAKFLEGTVDEMVALGATPEVAQQGADFLVQAFQSAGGNSKLLNDLLDLENAATKQGYNLYLPQDLRKAEWFSESQHRPLLQAISREWTNYMTNLSARGVKKITSDQIDEFFTRMINVFEGETRAKVLGVVERYNALREIGFDANAGGWSKTAFIPDETAPITTDAAKLLKDSPDISKLGSKQKSKIRQTLAANGVEIDSVIDDTGYIHLIEGELEKFTLHTPEGIKSWNDGVIDAAVEEPAKQLVRDLLAEGKIPVSSNAYGPGRKGVEWKNLGNDDIINFTPLKSWELSEDAKLVLRDELMTAGRTAEEADDIIKNVDVLSDDFTIDGLRIKESAGSSLYLDPAHARMVAKQLFPRSMFVSTEEEALNKAVAKLKEKADAWEAANRTISREEAEALAKKLPEGVVPGTLDESLQREARITNIYPNRPDMAAWEMAAQVDGKIRGRNGYFFSDAWLGEDSAYRNIDKNLLQSLVDEVINESNLMRAKILDFFKDIYPGPLAGDRGNKGLWDRFFRQSAYTNNNLNAFKITNIEVPLKNGTFNAGLSINAADMFEMSGIRPVIDRASGEIVELRMFNPVTGEINDINNPTIIDAFKRKTGVYTQNDLVAPLRALDDEGNPKILLTDVQRQNLVFDMIPIEFPSFEKMIQDDKRLSLALSENRFRDANIILAEKFQFPTMYKRQGVWTPDSRRLFNTVRRWSNLQDFPDITDLHSLPPESTYYALKNWYESNVGVSFSSRMTDAKPKLIKAFQSIFNETAAEAEGTYEFYKNIAEAIGKLSGDNGDGYEGWGVVLRALYRENGSAGTQIVRSFDGTLKLHSDMRVFLNRMDALPVKKADLRKMLVNEFGKEDVEFLGLHTALRGNTTITPQEILGLVKKNERFVQSKPEGINKRWFTSVKDVDGNDVYRFGADLITEQTPRGLEYVLKVAEETGTLDDLTKKYVIRWAGDNGFAQVVFKDGTSSQTIVRNFNMGSGTYGATTRIKSELDSVQSIVRGYANANVTTGIHELFHAFYPYLPLQDKAALEAWAKPLAEAWVKANPGKLTVEAKVEELITVGWEKFLVTAIDAPVEAQVVMDRMRNSMLSIYRKWDKYFDGIDMPEHVKQSFKNLLDKDYLLKQINEMPKPQTGKLYQGVMPANTTPVGRQAGVFDWKLVQLLKTAPDKLQVNFIKNNLLQGVKADEKALFSMDQFLKEPVFFGTAEEIAAKETMFKSKGLIMKEDVLNWIESRNIKVMEVVKGESETKKIKELMAHDRDTYDKLTDGWVKESERVRYILRDKWNNNELDPHAFGSEAYYALENLVSNDNNWAMRRLIEYDEDFIGSPIEMWLLKEATPAEMDTFHQIYKSSKTVYDEIKHLSSQLTDLRTRWQDYAPRNLQQGYNEIIFLAPAIEKDAAGWITAAPYGQYTYATHWGDMGDPMIHVRFGTYLDPDSNKTFLYVDEIQSDWSQQTRSRGSRFELEEAVDRLKKAKEEAEAKLPLVEWENTQEFKDMQAEVNRIRNELNDAVWEKTAKFKKLTKEYEKARKAVQDYSDGSQTAYETARDLLDKWEDDYYKDVITSQQWTARHSDPDWVAARAVMADFNDEIDRLQRLVYDASSKLDDYVRNERAPIDKAFRQANRKLQDYELTERSKLTRAINDFDEELSELTTRSKREFDAGGAYYLTDADGKAYEALMALPNMSFTKDAVMHELVMKRLMQWCMENNLDEIVLSPGRPHFERWGTEMLGWKKMQDGTIKMVSEGNMSGSSLGDVILDPNRPGGFTFTGTRLNSLFSQGYGTSIIDSYEDVLRIAENNVYFAPHWYTNKRRNFRLEKIAKDIWDRMQTEDYGFVFPRAEGLTGFYDSSLLNNVKNFFKKNYKKTVEITDPVTKKTKKVQVPGVEIEPYTLPAEMFRGSLSDEIVEVQTFIEAAGIYNDSGGYKLWADVPDQYGNVSRLTFQSVQDIEDAFNKGYAIKFRKERELVAAKIKFSPEAFEEAKLNGFTLMQKIGSIPTDDVKVWAGEMIKALDTLFVDQTTGFSTVFNNYKMKPVVVSIVPDGYNYIIHNFTEDQSKKYIENTADAIRGSVTDPDLVTYQAEHGRFLVSFDTQDEVDQFLTNFYEKTSNPLTFYGHDRTWNVFPEYSIGINKNKSVADAFGDSGRQMTDKINESIDKWLAQSGIDKSALDPNGNMEQMVSRLVSPSNVQPGTLYQKIEGDLGVLHNIQINHLFDAVNMWDGLPMPSIGIFKRGQFMESFGNATIILKKDSIDPVRDIMNKVYDTDAYTPMIPAIVKYTAEPYAISIDGENLLDLAKSLGETEGQMAMLLDHIAAEDLPGFSQSLMDSNVGMYFFLKRKGYDIDSVLQGIQRGSKKTKNDITYAFRSLLGSDPDITKEFV